MLWLCLDFPALGRDAVAAEATTAVIGAHGSHRWLIAEACNISGTQNLAAGTSLAKARAHIPELLTRPRDPAAERQELEALAHLLYRFGSPVVVETVQIAEPYWVPRWRVSVEIGASLSLFGGVESLHEAAIAALADYGAEARCGIAPTRSAASLMAACGETAPCLSRQDLPHRLAALPLTCLPWPAAQREALTSVGFRTLGELLALPRSHLLQRFGAFALHDLENLLGERSEPFIAIEPPPVFAACFELHGEIDNVETLLFPLKRMTQRFAAYLAARALTCSHCRLELRHDEGAPTLIPLQLLSPSREATRWFEFLRERLYRTPPDRPVRELHLSADDFLPISGSQFSLFETHRLSRERQTMLEKLLARYGEKALWHPAMDGDHRPEKSWFGALALNADSSTAQKPGSKRSGEASAPFLSGNKARPGVARRQRPLWLLPVSRAIARQQAEGLPERIQTGWWDQAPASRDYHRIRLGKQNAWVYRDLDSSQWYLHGLWD